MNCDKCGPLLSLYAGGDLSEEEQTGVHEHLVKCQTCRAELDGMKKTISLLNSVGLPDDALPDEDPSYWHEVESKFRARSHDIARLSERTSWQFRFSGSFAQAAAILLVAGAVIFYSIYGVDNAGTLDTIGGAGYTRKSPVIFVRPDYADGSEQVNWGYLGVKLVAVKGFGLRIKTVIPGSPAEKTGLRPGDILVSVQAPGQPKQSFRAASASLSAFPKTIGLLGAGNDANFGVIRNRTLQEVTIRLDQLRKPSETSSKSVDDEENTHTPVPAPSGLLKENPKTAVYVGVEAKETEGGLIVQRVFAYLPTVRAGLEVGDVITSVNGGQVRTLTDLRRLLAGSKPNDELKFEVKRNGTPLDVTLRVDVVPRGYWRSK